MLINSSYIYVNQVIVPILTEYWARIIFSHTCPLTASISAVSLWIIRFRSAISVLVDLRSSPYLLADVCISSYYTKIETTWDTGNPHVYLFPTDCFEINTIPNHLGLVPSLSFSTCSVGNVFILSPDFSHNSIHVKITTVVHLNNDRCIFDLALKLTQFLNNKKIYFFTPSYINFSSSKKNVSLGIVTKKCYLKKLQRIHRMQAFFKVFIGREDKTMSFNWFLTYLLIDWPEEVDFICQTLKLGLQLNLIHVGLIYILETI